MTIDLTTLTVMNDIRERLLALTDEEMAWAERTLATEKKRKKDRDIGEVTNPATRALYALSIKLAAESRLETSKSSVALDPIIQDEHSRQAVLLHDLADVSRELFWAQAKIDLAFYKFESLACRAGFVVTNRKPEGFPSFSSFMRNASEAGDDE